MPKIVIIGAASASFGPAVLGDLFIHANVLRGSEIWLVDTAPEALHTMYAYAQRLNAACGSPYSIHQTTERRDALPLADFVIVSVAVNRIATWKLDWQIPLRHGVRHVLGENGGPGGLSHALRNIPLILSIARDVETLAPNAWLLNFTNPMSRICLALHRHTRVKFIGLCHQIGEGYRLVNQVLQRVPLMPTNEHLMSEQQRSDYRNALESRYHLQAAGINHFTFFTAMHDRQTGEDLYPEFRTRVAKMPASFELLSRRWLDTFGLFCATGDGHAAEYVGYGAETMELSGYDFDAYEQRGAAQWQHIRDVASGTQPPSFIASGERAAQIMCAITRDSNTHELSANFVNRGVIRNLPDDAIVETPATVNATGIHGMHIGELPTGIAAMMRQQIDIQELVVEAAVTGNRAAAMQALLLDPHIHSYAQADHLLDDLSQAHGFFGK